MDTKTRKNIKPKLYSQGFTFSVTTVTGSSLSADFTKCAVFWNLCDIDCMAMS
jgi:hypothetical protein